MRSNPVRLLLIASSLAALLPCLELAAQPTQGTVILEEPDFVQPMNAKLDKIIEMLGAEPTDDQVDQADPLTFEVFTVPLLAPIESSDPASAPVVEYGTPIAVSATGPHQIKVFANATGDTVPVDSPFVLPAEGMHTVIVTPDDDQAPTRRFFVRQEEAAETSGDGFDLPPVDVDVGLVTKVVTSDKAARDDYYRDHGETFTVEDVRYVGQDTHQLTNGLALRVTGKEGGTVNLRNLEVTDTSAGIVAQGLSKTVPADVLNIESVRIGGTYRNGVNRSNYTDVKPQPLYTANFRQINVDGLAIFGSMPPGWTETPDRIHGWYLGTGSNRYNETEVNLKNVLIYEGGYGGLNASQIHNAENVIIIGSAVNWNLDGELDGQWGFPRVTGTVKNCWSIDPHEKLVYGANDRVWGYHTFDRVKIPGITTIDENPLDMDKVRAAPLGGEAAEALRQLKELGYIQ